MLDSVGVLYHSSILGRGISWQSHGPIDHDDGCMHSMKCNTTCILVRVGNLTVFFRQYTLFTATAAIFGIKYDPTGGLMIS